MKLRVVLLLCAWLAIRPTVFGQAPATIEKTEISGIPEDQLSSALRADLQKLVGQAYDEKAAQQIAERIQTELPEYVATPTTAPGTEASRILLVFVIAHNINARYFVEAVELKDIDKSKVSEALWADMQKMVGHPVDDAGADRMRDRLAVELKNKHVRRSVVRGNQPQHVRIVYEAPGQNSIGFSFTGGYHSRQKFSGRLDLRYTFFDFTGVNVAAVNNAEKLSERYAGLQYGYWIGYKRVRFDMNYSSFKAQWSPGTLLAASTSSAAGLNPGLYRLRDTIEPTVKLTITPGLHITLGAFASQLQLQSPALHFESVRTATGNLEYGVYATSSGNHLISGNYDLHVSGNTLNSSRTYTRHVWDQSYTLKRKQGRSKYYSWAWDRMSVDLKLGRITGSAPMFERFTLGSARTLVGWDKNEIAPLGASRVAYGAISYAGKYASISFQSGALWDSGQPKVLRKSIDLHILRLGDIVHAPGPLRFFLNVAVPGIGIPLRSSNGRPMFTLGGS